MALSVLLRFLQAVAAAAAQLGRDAHQYSDPQNPLRYGPEIDALRRACVAAVDAPYDPGAGARVLRLAASVMRFTIPLQAPVERQAFRLSWTSWSM